MECRVPEEAAVPKYKYIFPRYGQNSGPVAENGAGLPNHIGRYPILYDMDYGVPPHMCIHVDKGTVLARANGRWS